MTLVLLAAGLGSRFGGPKQFHPVGPNGECLIHYSLRHGFQAGFDSVVIVTRAELENQAKQVIDPFLPEQMTCEYVIQNAAGGKPRGTGAAVLQCESVLNQPFVVCNGDDFYGHETFGIVAELLQSHRGENDAVMVPFEVTKTLSDNGGGSRAQVRSHHGRVENLRELRDVERKSNGEIWGRSEEGEDVQLCETEKVSMNMFGFQLGVLEVLKDYDAMMQRDYQEREVGLPQFLNWGLSEGRVSLYEQVTKAQWIGLTFPDDVLHVSQQLKNLSDSSD